MAHSVTLLQLRTDARLYADQRPGGAAVFVDDTNVNRLINLARQEFYDLLVALHGQEYFEQEDTSTVTAPNTATYSLPTDFYRMLSVHLAWSTTCLEQVRGLNNIADRDGVGTSWAQDSLKTYRLRGSLLEFFPTPQSATQVVLRYVPTCPELVDDADSFDDVNGWGNLVALKVACKLKAIANESMGQLNQLYERERQRVEEMAADRAVNEPTQIRDLERNGWGVAPIVLGGCGGSGITRVDAANPNLIYNFPYIDARHHGALTSNSASAADANVVTLNAAITAANAASVALQGPCAVWVPAGKYWIATTLSMLSNVTLMGSGMGKTTFYMPSSSYTNTTAGTYGGASVAISALGALSGGYEPLENVTLRDLTVESQVSDGRHLYPILARNVENLKIHNVEGLGIPAGNLITLDSIRGASSIHHCYLHDCTSANAGSVQLTGIEIDNNPVNYPNLPSTGIEIYANHIEDLTFSGAALPSSNMNTDGINPQGGVGLQIHNNYISNVGEAIDCFASECNIHSNNLDDCYNVGVKLIHGASRNKVHNNSIMRPGLAGLYIAANDTAATDDNYLSDNLIHDVNTAGHWTSTDNAGLLIDDQGGAFKPSNNTFRDNKVTGGASMKYAVRNECGTNNRFYDTEAESCTIAYSSVSAGTATITNAKKTFVRAYVGSDQTFAASTVVVNFTTEQTDTQSEYTAGTPVFTANSHRRLRVYARVRFSSAGAANETYNLRIRKNGVATAVSPVLSPNTNEFAFDVEDTLDVVPADTIDVTIQHTSAGSRTITGNATLSYLTIEEVAA